MVNNFEVIIGIETHVVLNTKTKMFSNAPNNYHDVPNLAINEIDLGLPGILPNVNKSAIKKAIWLGLALKANINWKNIQFDRKNYYYLDLPKGYQITQQYHPIGSNGIIKINVDGEEIPIEIERFHLEEDTAKQIQKDGKILLDYNRSGAPLIEIVTKPTIKSSEQAGEYLRKLIQILQFNNISDAKLESGSIRADINVSIRVRGQKTLNNKVEIKNVNSINNAITAINYEIERQTQILLSNGIVEQETRKFDEEKNITVFMRKKSNAVNYRYFHEDNIPTIKLTENDFKLIEAEKKKDIEVIIEELRGFGFNDKNVSLLLNNYDMYCVFAKIITICNNPLLCFNWVGVELQGYLNKSMKKWTDLSYDFVIKFGEMLKKLNNEDINGKQAKVILEKIFNKLQDIDELIKELGFVQIKDVAYLTNIIQDIINENKEIVTEYDNRPERVEKFIIGMVMKKTNAQANPKISYEITKKILDNK